MIKAEILASSINLKGVRLVTWLLTYPRIIHSEFMTHRAFSRNAASSRAIPFRRMLAMALENTAFPEYWGGEKAGMATAEQVDEATRRMLEHDWKVASSLMVDQAQRMHQRGVHKSIPNRLLEFCSHITVVATASEHDNFFHLRASPQAEPTFQKLAYVMLEKYLERPSEQLDWGQWHLPFGDRMPADLDLETRLKVAVARCARVSYLTFDGEHSVEKDVELHDKLAKAGHWSPFEHIAQAHTSPYGRSNFDFGQTLSGWTQYRKMFEGERAQNVDLTAILASRPEWTK